jgi:hypothetical protein
MCFHMNQIRARSSYLKQEKSNPLVWQTGLFDFVDSNGSQGRYRQSTMMLLLRPSDVWTEDRLEPRQPEGLW